MGHEYVKEPETFNTTRNGTVPKPTAQEVSDNKFLRADGSWQNGSGGGASELNDLNDVEVSTPANNQALLYDNSESKFLNKSILLSMLGDIDLTSLANRQILQYDSNAGKFKNVSPVIKGVGDIGTGFYAFQIGSASGSAKEELFGTFGAYCDATGFIFGRTQLCYFGFGVNDVLSSYDWRGASGLISTMPSRRYDTATGKLYFTVPAWGQLWFLGWLNGVTAKA